MSDHDPKVSEQQAALHVPFARLHAASRADPSPPLAARRARLERLLAILDRHGPGFERAISADFGHRARQETQLAEIVFVEAAIRHALRHLKGWMRPKRVRTSPIFWPGRNRLLPQPLGVAGIVSPWNYPLQLTLAPAVGALAAGNRIMIKPSEQVPEFCSLLQRAIEAEFAADEIAVATGGADVGRAFCALPFDHLLFTGSAAVGRRVAAAAAQNLTPVTLELGGKSPAIVDGTADIASAALRIAYGKLLNAGQTCIAPDYVLCAVERVEAFVAAYAEAVRRMYSDDPANPDCTAIISRRHLDRLREVLADAVAKGARADVLVGDAEAWQAAGRFPPTLVRATTPDMRLRREEIFGPILPVVAVADVAEAIAIVNGGDRPLALYWFGADPAARERVLTGTVSGGVTINDCLLHQAQERQPFGGVGTSGMGAYHGEWGFRTFSMMKPVFYRPRLSGAGMLKPPYGQAFDRALAVLRRLT